MTTMETKDVSPTIRNKAAKLAKSSGENVVVYETVIGRRTVQLIATESQYKNSPHKDEIKFIALLDNQGSYIS